MTIMPSCVTHIEARKKTSLKNFPLHPMNVGKKCHKPPIWEWFESNLFMVIWGMVSGIFLPNQLEFDQGIG